MRKPLFLIMRKSLTANEVAVGDLEHFTSPRYFQTPESQRSPIQEPKKHTSMIRPSQRGFQISLSSLEMSWITSLMKVLSIE